MEAKEAEVEEAKEAEEAEERLHRELAGCSKMMQDGRAGWNLSRNAGTPPPVAYFLLGF